MSTEQLLAGRPRRTRSHSQLSDFQHCGWSFRLKRLMKVKETPSVWLPGGTAFHTATEEFDRTTFAEQDRLQEWDDPTPWVDVFHEAFDARLAEFREQEPDETKWRTAGRPTRDKPNGEDVDFWRGLGPKLVGDYIEWRISTADTWRIATVEGAAGIEVEVRTETPGDGVPLVAYVDRLLESRLDGGLVLLDLKSGSRMPASPQQLAEYSVWLEPRVGRPITWGAYYNARKGGMSELVDLSHFNASNVGMVFDTLDRAIQQNLFLPHIDSHCTKCGVRRACVWVGGQEPSAPEVVA